MTQNNVAAHNAAVNARLNAVKMPALTSTRSYARKPLNRCECGCDGLTGNRFVPGHDAKLLARVKRVEAGIVTLEWLAEAYGQAVADATAKALPMQTIEEAMIEAAEELMN